MIAYVKGTIVNSVGTTEVLATTTSRTIEVLRMTTLATGEVLIMTTLATGEVLSIKTLGILARSLACSPWLV